MSRVTFSFTVLIPAALAAQTQPLVPTTYYRTFSHTNPILKRIRAGEIVATQTVDSSGRDLHSELRHPEPGNPLTGPFFIEGAEPGDAIRVQLRKVRLNRNWGYTGYRLLLDALEPAAIEGLYPNKYKPDTVIKGRSNYVRWDLDLERKTVKLRDPASARIKMEFPAIP